MVSYIEISESMANTSYASTEYDWHATGGNLDITTIGKIGKNRLVQPSMSCAYDIRVLPPLSEFKHTTLDTMFNWSRKYFCYELMQSESFLGVRQRQAINFLLRSDLDEEVNDYEAPIEFKWGSEIAASVLNKNQLIFADVRKNLYRTNVDKLRIDSVVQLSREREPQPVSVNCVDDNIVSATTLKALSLVDFRMDLVSTIFDSSHFHMNCEELSYNKFSLHDNLLFLASSHLLYAIDLRYTKVPVIHWTHQLIQQPTMLKTIKHYEDEVICLSSNMPGDLKVFNTSKGIEENSWFISKAPVVPRHVKNSYQSIREQGKLLLSAPIKQRVNLSTTGIAMLVNKKKSTINLFTQNSFGDIFKSHLHCDDQMDEDSKIMNNFMLWDEALKVERNPHKFLPIKERQKISELHFTDIVKLKGLRKVMRCEKLCPPNEADETSQMMSEKIPRWKIEIEEAKDYRDGLSQHLLAEWDLQIDEARPQIFAEALAASDFHQQRKTDKVAAWLIGNASEEEIRDHDETMDNHFISTPEVRTHDAKITQQTAKKKVSKLVKGF